MSSPAAGENRLTRIPARTRARDTRATDSVFGSCVILRNSAVAGNRPESPAGIYINPGGLEGVRVRINRFTAPAKGVRVWQFTVHVPLSSTYVPYTGIEYILYMYNLGTAPNVQNWPGFACCTPSSPRAPPRRRRCTRYDRKVAIGVHVATIEVS